MGANAAAESWLIEWGSLCCAQVAALESSGVGLPRPAELAVTLPNAESLLYYRKASLYGLQFPISPQNVTPHLATVLK